MRAAVSTYAIAATLVLHAALLVAVLHEWPAPAKSQAEAPPMTVRLLTPPVVAPVTATEPPVASPPPSAPPVEQQQASEPKPKPKVAPPKRRATPPAKDTPPKAAPPRATEAPTEMTTAPPAASATSPSSDIGAPSAPPAPALPPPPVKRPPSEASYAASNRKPAYPALSRRYGEQGTVVLRVLVQADGSAGAVEIKSSSGHRLLDESALSTVRGWRFTPATSDGKPVAEWYQLAIPFKLHD